MRNVNTENGFHRVGHDQLASLPFATHCIPSTMGRLAALMLVAAAMGAAPAQASESWKRVVPFEQASAGAVDAAQAVIDEAGSEECLRGKLSNAIVRLSNSCDARGLTSSACVLASDIAGQDNQLSKGEMLSTSHELLRMLSDDTAAR